MRKSVGLPSQMRLLGLKIEMGKKYNLVLTIFCCIILIAGGYYYFFQTTFINPVFEPVLADPSIIKAENGYMYAYGTEDEWDDGKGPKFIPIVKSKNMVDWEYIGDGFKQSNKPSWKDGGLWAPHVTFYRNQYYLYYSLSVWGDANPGIGVATSKSPEGPFEDHGRLFTSEEIGVPNSIDPMFYVDEGIPYLFWGSFNGIYGVELTKDGLSVKGTPFQIAGNAFEAPFIIKRDSYYYLFVSSGSCCEGTDSTYNVAVGRSKSITGPYVDKIDKDLMYSRGTTILLGKEKSKFVGPGHNAVITDEAGTDWIVYHAYEKENPWMESGAPRRALLIDPILWKDGWPDIKDMEPGSDSQRVPKTR
jgi:arabinan endo-1,5-alpha-L-arabinosidase